MSRIGKKPIQIPQGVDVKVFDSRISVKGPKGELSVTLRPEIRVEVAKDEILVSPKPGINPKKEKRLSAFWGLTRALIFNMVNGVASGFEKKLEMIGIGYRATLDGEDLVLSVGFSHPVKVKAQPGIKFSIEKSVITVSGTDKELVGQVAAKIRQIKRPEPYKGKGIRYVGEFVRRKLGKKAATGAAAK